MEQSQKITVSVGIPAYNEERNISELVSSLLKQKQDGFVLEEIIVASDGSDDATCAKVREFGSQTVRLIDNKERKGPAERMNQIMDECRADALVMLNADIFVPRKDFLSRMVRVIIDKEADLVSADVFALPPVTFVEKILKASFDFKKKLFRRVKGGQSIFLCFGAGRAFSRKLYKKMRFSDSVGEDAYSYLFCKKHGLGYANARNAQIGIRLPNNIKDHKKQSLRFSDSKSRFTREFGGKFVEDAYSLPPFLVFREMVRSFVSHPVLTFCFLVITAVMRAQAIFAKKGPDQWEISESSKQVIVHKEKPRESFLLAMSRMVFVRRMLYAALAFFDKIFFLSNKVVILSYHSVSDGDFYFGTPLEDLKKQVLALESAGYRFISVQELEGWLQGKQAIGAREKVCLLTFDDGYKDVIAAKEFFMEKNIRPILFVLSNEENACRDELTTDKPFLSKKDVRLLMESGWSVGSHSATHRSLAEANKMELKEEIAGSKKTLEEKYGFPFRYFAYPKGVYSDAIVKEVESTGYSLAFSMDDGIITQRANKFIVPRVGINRSHGKADEFLHTFSPSVVRMRLILKRGMSIFNKLS